MEQFELFCKKVLHYVNHATPKERNALKSELREHLEDRAEALEAKGCPAEALETRTVAAMGDPETIGKELNSQFSFGWLILSRLALGLCVVLALLLLSPLDTMITRITGNLQAEYVPMAAFGGSDELEGRLWHYDPGLTAKVLDTTVRVYDVAATKHRIYVYLSQYADSPFQSSIRVLDNVTTFPSRGGGYFAPFDARIEIPIDNYQTEGQRIQREDLLFAPNYIRIDYDGTGYDFSFTIPLEGGVAP